MTQDDDLPDAVKRAVADLIDSLDGLEVLLLLYRGRSRSFTAADVAIAVGIQEAAARRQLERMKHRRLAVPDGTADALRYAPADEALEAQVETIAAAHGRQRIALINHVASSALQRIRALADAFKLGKGRNDG